MARDTVNNGAQKAAIVMMLLGEERCGRLFGQMHEDEIREISASMSQLGIVPSQLVESVCLEFSRTLGSTEAIVGDLDTTERLLRGALPANRATAILEEIRGPAGRTMWDKLANVPEAVLAKYLRNEYPQTVAVIVSRIDPSHAAKVLALLPEAFSLDVMTRMLKLETLPKNVLHSVERTLRSEFVSNLQRGSAWDSHQVLAEIFNNFDRRNETRFMEKLDEASRDDAERVKSLMFTFEELAKLTPGGVMVLMNEIERERLPLALKGASEEVRTLFFGGMSERAGRLLRDEIAGIGPVRVKDVEIAQAEIVGVAKDLLERGEIALAEGENAGGEMIL